MKALPDRTVRGLLWIASVFCFLAAGCIVYFAMTSPVSVPGPIEEIVIANRRSLRSAKQAEEPKRLDRTDFFNVWNKTLQGPIADPVVAATPKSEVVKKEAKKPKPKIPFEGQLIGTLIDSDGSDGRAWIKWKGSASMVKEGEVLKDHPGMPTIASIEDRKIVVRLNDESITLQMTPTGSDWENDRAN